MCQQWFSDINLSDGNGYQLAQLLWHTKQVPILHACTCGKECYQNSPCITEEANLTMCREKTQVQAPYAPRVLLQGPNRL